MAWLDNCGEVGRSRAHSLQSKTFTVQQTTTSHNKSCNYATHCLGADFEVPCTSQQRPLNKQQERQKMKPLIMIQSKMNEMIAIPE